MSCVDYVVSMFKGSQTFESMAATVVERSRRPMMVVAVTPERTFELVGGGVTARDKFRLASLSKHFTAAAVCEVYHRLGLDLVSPIASVLGDEVPFSISMWELLTQTSGIRVNYMDLGLDASREAPLTLDQVLAAYADSDESGSPKNPKPAMAFVYNNTNYVLAAAVAQRLLDSPFHELVDELLASPSESGFAVRNLVTVNAGCELDHVVPDRSRFGRPLPMTQFDGVAGDGAIHASAQDLIGWMQFWRGASGDQRLRERLVAAMVNTETEYVFGYIRKSDEVLWHNGSWLGARGITIRSTDFDRWLFVVTNGQKSCERLGWNLWRLLSDDA